MDDNMEKKRLVHGSLFSGIGGFDLAAEKMGWHNVFHCEIDRFCNTILNYWFPDAELFTDITKTDFSGWRGRVDILTGGFPCQPFSIAGQRKGSDDNRYLWPEMLRAVREIQPGWIVGENVGGILSMVQPGQEVEVANEQSLFGEDNRKRVVLRQEYVIETICQDLECEGYSVQPVLIPACAVGAPHRRDRVWFIAKRNTSSDTDGQRRDGRGGDRKGRYVPGNRQRNAEKDKQEREKRQSGTCQDDRADVYADRIGLEGRFYKKQKGIPRVQSEIPGPCILRDWEDFPTQSPVCGRNDGFSPGMDGITFSKWRQESVKAYGNAIVPQVAFEIFKAIELTSNSL